MCLPFLFVSCPPCTLHVLHSFFPPSLKHMFTFIIRNLIDTQLESIAKTNRKIALRESSAYSFFSVSELTSIKLSGCFGFFCWVVVFFFNLPPNPRFRKFSCLHLILLIHFLLHSSYITHSPALSSLLLENSWSNVVSTLFRKEARAHPNKTQCLNFYFYTHIYHLIYHNTSFNIFSQLYPVTPISGSYTKHYFL